MPDPSKRIEVVCSNCGGNGYILGRGECEWCGGTGRVYAPLCDACEGLGYNAPDHLDICHICRGTGHNVPRQLTRHRALFDPNTAQTATTCDQAIELARAWADGRRSWVNRVSVGPDTTLDERLRQEAAIAAMDAQEVVKWSALAVALGQLEAIRKGRVLIPGVGRLTAGEKVL